MEMNQLGLLVFLLVFLRIQCLAVEKTMLGCSINSSAENPKTNQSREIHLDPDQTKRINRFSTEILFVSGRTIIFSLSYCHTLSKLASFRNVTLFLCMTVQRDGKSSNCIKLNGVSIVC